MVSSWENLMDRLKLLDALQPLEDGRVDDLLSQPGNLCQQELGFTLILVIWKISLLMLIDD